MGRAIGGLFAFRRDTWLKVFNSLIDNKTAIMAVFVYEHLNLPFIDFFLFYQYVYLETCIAASSAAVSSCIRYKQILPAASKRTIIVQRLLNTSPVRLTV